MEKTRERKIEKIIEDLSGQMVKGFADAEKSTEKKIADLAESTAVGFLDTQKRFDQVDVRFDRLEGRVDKVETRLGGVETRLNGVETRLDGVETRLGGVETRLDGVECGLVGIKTNIKTLFDWIKKIDRDLEAANAKLDRLAGRVEKNEKENKTLVIEVGRIDKELIKIKKILKIA